MTTQHELLFTDLNALTEEQIEAGLAAGVWRENRPSPPVISSSRQVESHRLQVVARRKGCRRLVSGLRHLHPSLLQSGQQEAAPVHQFEPG
jgi:hypothetical protein